MISETPRSLDSTPLGMALIGPGRVGQTLVTLLGGLGYLLQTIISRPQPDSPPLAQNFSFYLDNEILPAQNLLIITTPDDEIARTAQLLADLPIDWRDTIAIHCSGAFGSELLKPLQDAGARVGSLHPLKSIAQPITDIERAVDAFRDVYWCVEGDPAVLALADQLVKFVNGHTITIKTAMKPVYHAAAVMACGHLVALFDLSLNMLGECGIERNEAVNMLLPLVESTVKNLGNGSAAALTGPFARGDFNTINQHLQSLMRLDGNYSAVYTILGQQSLAIKKREE